MLWRRVEHDRAVDAGIVEKVEVRMVLFFYRYPRDFRQRTGEHIAGELEGTGASVIEYKNGIIAGQNLGGQIDVIVIDQLPAQSIGGDMDGYVVVELDAEPESYGIYMNKNATELKEKIDAALEVMIENGVIDYLVLKHSGAII